MILTWLGVHVPLMAAIGLLGIMAVVSIMAKGVRLAKGGGYYSASEWRCLSGGLGALQWVSFCGATVSFAYWWVIIGRINPLELTAVDAALVCVWGCGAGWVVANIVPSWVVSRWPNGVAGWVQSVGGVVRFVAPWWRWLQEREGDTRAAGGVRSRSDEWIELVDTAEKQGTIEEDERKMIHRIVSLSETTVREIMTPRSDAICVEAMSTIMDVKRVIFDQGHSRIPVYREQQDAVIGFVYAKDLLAMSDANQDESIESIIRPIVFIPETQNIETFLKVIRAQKTHLAIVVDEFGSMSGLVTLEDVMEEIVGEIQDEYDDELPQLNSVGENQFELDGGMAIADILERLPLPIPDSENYDTIGGFVLHELGKVPSEGERIQVGDYELVVKEVTGNRIRKIRCDGHDSTRNP